ncbi:MAG TPA: cation:proton antiporter [Fibrobacteria bacterium]|nr:cation:proton antiporter [Fibrobacteria bacterium]
MQHNIPLITTLAAGFGIALVLGFLAVRVRLPALVGYLVAGILIGPATPGFVADQSIASELSEVGVMLLMFGVGLHFSLADLMAVKRIALPGAIVQMGCATLLGMLASWLWDWNLGTGLIFGLSLSCASTVVLLKALEARNLLDTMNGKIAVGWLVVEDLACVLVLVLMPPLAGLLGGGVAEASGNQGSVWLVVGRTLLQVAAFVAIMIVFGRKFLPWILWKVAKTGSRELFTLTVVAAAIGIAYGASVLFNVSFALGAFFAGMMMRESEFSHRAAEESLPLRDAFSVLFFVAVGMLFDPAILIDEPWKVLVVVLIVVVGKTIAAFGLVLSFKYPLNTALTVAASLAQIGEFSFILAALGVSLSLLPQEGMSLVVAGSLISMALNPFLFLLVTPLRKWLLGRSQLAREFDSRIDPTAMLPASTESRYLQGQVVIVGYGRLGRRLAEGLDSRGVAWVVADQNRELVDDLRRRGKAAVWGDATDPGVLIQAHIANAAMLVVATSDPVDVRTMADTARTLNPDIEIVLRAGSEDEADLLHREAIGSVFYDKEELAKSLTLHVVERFVPKEG